MKTTFATLCGLGLALMLVSPGACVLALASALAYLVTDLMERSDE